MPWDQVEEYMHTDSGIDEDSLEADSWYEDLSDSGNGAGDYENPADVNRKSAGGMVQKASGSGEKRSAGYSYSGSYETSRNCRRFLKEPSAL